METDTPVGWLERASGLAPDAPALVTGEGVVSYADLGRLVHRRAAALGRIVVSGEIVPMVPRLDVDSVVEILSLMKAGAVVLPHTGEAPPTGGEAPPGAALCLRTSGSGGRPRIVPLTFANLSASVIASRKRLGNGPADRWLATLPLHHVGGLSVVLRSLEAGGAAVIAPFDAGIVDVALRTQPTIASLVPTMVYRMLESDPEALASIGTVLVGGARFGVALHGRCIAAGVGVLPTYGMTEASSQIATAVPGTPPTPGDVVGPVLEGFRVTIHTDSGSAAGGQTGSIEVDGPGVFGGYLGGEPRRGPHRTTDIGYLDPDGSLAVIGRSDDVVVTGGENVSLSLVADAIGEVGGVRDVVVVGSSDPEWGTVICALVELDDDRSIGGVVDEVAWFLPPHAIPKHVEAGSIPLLANGKHDVAAVRRRFDER